ncbi:MAG: CRISPR-associated protein Cas5 [Deltaproteobacteria bacterium]|nr:CRISPR-associated protein Cas5 [Deltaproteobacteria bacterium]
MVFLRLWLPLQSYRNPYQRIGRSSGYLL